MKALLQFLNKLWMCIFVWKIPAGNIQNGDVIICFAASETLHGSPGLANEYLAGLVIWTRINISPTLPIIAQGEILPCLGAHNKFVVGVIPRQADSPKYLNTIDVAKAQKKICEQKGYKRPILITLRPHMLRALFVCRKIGLQAIPCNIPGEPYDDCSLQWWMRNRLINNFYELACRLVWLFQGKM